MIIIRKMILIAVKRLRSNKWLAVLARKASKGAQSTQNIQRQRRKVLKNRDILKFNRKPEVVEAVIAEWESHPLLFQASHPHTILNTLLCNK